MAAIFKKNISLKGNILYSAVKVAVERNEDAKNWWDAFMTGAKTKWNIFANGWAEAAAGAFNLLKLDFDAAWKNRQHARELGIYQEEDTYSSGKAALERSDLNKKVIRHNDIVMINNNAIDDYVNELQNIKLPLDKQIELLGKIQELENRNWTYVSSDTSDLYYNFKKSEYSQYRIIEMDNEEDLSRVEEYFDLLNKGFKLNLDQKTEYVSSIYKILSKLTIGWEEDVKAQFKSYFLQALENNESHGERVSALQSYTDTAKKKLAREPASPIQKSEVMPGKKLFSSVSIEDTFKPTQVPTFPFTVVDTTSLEKELQEQKEYYEQDINAYIAYLKQKRELLAEDQSAEGLQGRAVLDEAIQEAVSDKQVQLQTLLSQYQSYTTQMASLTQSYQADMALLNQAMKEAETEGEKQRIEEAIDLRSDGYTASLAGLETEHAGFSKVLFGDLQQMSKEALDAAIAEARDFIAKWAANAGELSPETEKVIGRIKAGIDKAEASFHNTGGNKTDKPVLAEQFREAAKGLQTCADLASVFDKSLGAVIQTAADVAAGASDIATGVATFSANPLQGATSILSGVTKIVGSFGKRIQENERIRKEYLQGLVETYSKELEYNSVLRERLRIQQQLGETSLDYFNRLQAELVKQQGDVNREYTEVWNKLMQEEYVSGTGYKHGTWFRKAKTWKEYDSLAGKSYEEIESLYTQDKLEGSAKTLFERLRQLKEEGANVTEMMDQLNEEMKESWTGTTTSAITDSIVQGFLDGKRSAADFADTFEDLMKTAMMQSVKMKYLEGPLDEWYKQFAEASESGLTEEKIAELRRQYEQIVENAAREAENMEAITGLGTTEMEAARTATAQGIASMSQETATELNGNFYALQYLTSNIDRNVTNIQSVLYQASDHWLRIEENTRYCRKLETIERDMASVRKDMQDINNKGILMRTR